MENILVVIFFSLIGGVVSLIGGFLLIADKKRAKKLAKYATSFAAGALLAAAFFDLLHEAIEKGDVQTALSATLFGILAFFLLERFLRWFHHHHEHDEDKKNDPSIPLIVIGDTVHNFIDGIAIAAAFLVDVPTGIIVTLAVAAHEIPQEIGDFGLLLHKGMSRKNVIIVNISSALATTIAAVLFYTVGQSISLPLDIILGIVAGFFIYIAVSDIIPDIHKSERNSFAGPQTALLILGVIIVGTVTTQLHAVIDATDSHSDTLHEHEPASEHRHENDEHDTHDHSH